MAAWSAASSAPSRQPRSSAAPPARRDDRRHRVPAARRRRRRRPARAHPGRRVSRGGRASRPRGAAGTERPGEVRRSPLAREVTPRPLILVVIDGLTPSMLEGAIGVRRDPDARRARRARHLPARDLRLPVADSRLPLVDRDRRARRHPRDPAPRLVRPARGAARRVRQLVRRGARRRDRPDPARHARQHEPRSTSARGAVTLFESLADAGLRTAAVNFTAYRGRTPHRSSLPFLGDVLGPGAVLLLQPVQLGPHRRAALLAQPAGRLDRRLRGGGRPLARDARRLRLPRLLPLRLRLRLARARPRHRARDAAALRRRGRRARRGGRRARRAARALLRSS